MSLFGLLKKKIVERGEAEKAKIAEKEKQEAERKINAAKRKAEEALRKEEELKIAKLTIKRENPILTFNISKIGHEDHYHSYNDIDDYDLYSPVTIEQDWQNHDEDSEKDREAYIVSVDGRECGEVSETIYQKIESLNIDPMDMTAYVTNVDTTSDEKAKAKVSVYNRRIIHTYIAGTKYDNEDGSSRQEVARSITLDSLLQAKPIKFKGEDAVELWYQDKMIGYVVKDLASEITKRMKDGSLHDIKALKKSKKDNIIYVDISIDIS